MKTNVDLEFISKVRDLSDSMRILSNFWAENQNELNYPFSESFDNLALNTYNWLLALINSYCEKDPIDFFNTYYETLQK